MDNSSHEPFPLLLKFEFSGLGARNSSVFSLKKVDGSSGQLGCGRSCVRAAWQFGPVATVPLFELRPHAVVVGVGALRIKNEDNGGSMGLVRGGCVCPGSWPMFGGVIVREASMDARNCMSANAWRRETSTSLSGLMYALLP